MHDNAGKYRGDQEWNLLENLQERDSGEQQR